MENYMSLKVFDFFSEISKIPRGSGKEEKISNWLVSFAKKRNLEVFQDEYYNVIIKKEASIGYEKYEPIILQGHIDMVWEKNKNKVFDFENEGIKLKVEDGFIKAEGTTLGADNGIAVAIALAILDSDDLKHPKLEVVLTTDEEVGMSGALNLDTSILKGKKMINIDTEEFGAIYVSSAGGATIEIDSHFENLNLDTEEKIFKLEITGLKGGHSGADIHLNLGNSIKILTNLLKELLKEIDFNIVEIDGGNKDNAIPRESMVIISIKNSENELINKVNSIFLKIKDNYKELESDIRFEVTNILKNDLRKISLEDTKKIIDFYNEFPHGVISMSQKIENLVQTSLNFGVLKTKRNEKITNFKVRSLLRSSNIKELDELQERLINLSNNYSFISKKVPSFKPWEYRETSTLREHARITFKKLFKKDATIKAIHAGLECGLFTTKINDLDVISIGPNIYGAHTPDEKMEIKSVVDTYNYIIKILEEYNLVD